MGNKRSLPSKNGTSPSATTRVVSVEQRELYAGPIPSAREFAKYEEVVPGSADRILRMAEEQSKHRREIEKQVVRASIKNSQRGQLIGFVITMIVLGISVWLLATGRELAGFGTILLDLATLVGVFVYNRVSERKERQDKKGMNK